MRLMEHNGDGRDDSGRGLEITIRIGPDGRLYLADITADLLAVATALLPGDESLRARAERAGAYRWENAT